MHVICLSITLYKYIFWNKNKNNRKKKKNGSKSKLIAYKFAQRTHLTNLKRTINF